MSDRELTANTVRERLGLGEEALAWLEELQSVGEPPKPVELPPPNEIAVLLARLGVPSARSPEVADAMPSPERDPALWWILARCHHLLVRDMGRFDQMRSWPSLPPDLGATGRYFYVWVFLATLDAVRQFHQTRGIPDDVSWASLADLGQNITVHERLTGDGGLSAQNWLTLHWRGALYQLGRLQFNRSRIYYDDATLDRLDTGIRHGDAAVGVHIPATGPFSPEACDASFRWARDFFARHFPETPCHLATCGSWLLDDQLAEYLPETSNIIRFQRRFHMIPGGREADREIVRFVFGRVPSQIDELPQDTTLQRAIVQHLRAGRHWQVRFGWLTL